MFKGRARVVKREAEEKPSDDDDCVIYRYGSFCTGIEVFGESLSSLEIFIQTSEVFLEKLFYVFVFRGY